MQVVLTLVNIIQAINVVEVSKSLFQTRASVSAAALSLSATLMLLALSYFEHSRNIRPSSIIAAYLLATVSFNAVQLRSRWLRGDNLVSNALASTLLGLELLVLIVESVGKRGVLISRYAVFSPEAISGPFSRGFFWWLNPLFRLGFRGDINDNDLFSTDGDLSSTACESRLTKRWKHREYSQSCYVSSSWV